MHYDAACDLWSSGILPPLTYERALLLVVDWDGRYSPFRIPWAARIPDIWSGRHLLYFRPYTGLSPFTTRQRVPFSALTNSSRRWTDRADSIDIRHDMCNERRKLLSGMSQPRPHGTRWLTTPNPLPSTTARLETNKRSNHQWGPKMYVLRVLRPINP